MQELLLTRDKEKWLERQYKAQCKAEYKAKVRQVRERCNEKLRRLKEQSGGDSDASSIDAYSASSDDSSIDDDGNMDATTQSVPVVAIAVAHAGSSGEIIVPGTRICLSNGNEKEKMERIWLGRLRDMSM